MQKSNLGNYFELNIKVFVQGLFNERYTRSKEMVKKLTGDVFVRAPERFRPVLDGPLPSDDRARAVEALLIEFIDPVTADALTRAGLTSLASRGLVHLLLAVRQELATR